MSPAGPDAQLSSASLRREVGPVAWCALECLFEHSLDGGRTAAASVRSVADELGIAKNTAHRAIRALVRAGLVEGVQTRTGDGRFRVGRYRLHVDALVVDQRMSQRRTQRSKQQLKSDIASQQLTLIEAT